MPVVYRTLLLTLTLHVRLFEGLFSFFFSPCMELELSLMRNTQLLVPHRISVVERRQEEWRDDQQPKYAVRKEIEGSDEGRNRYDLPVDRPRAREADREGEEGAGQAGEFAELRAEELLARHGIGQDKREEGKKDHL